MIKLLSHPAFQAIIAILGLAVAVIALVIQGGGANNEATATPASASVVVGLRNTDIRSGPGPEFSSVGVLSAGNSLDVLGITEDRLWYLVLMADGRRGWVIAASGETRLESDGRVVPVVAPTATPRPDNTISPSATPQAVIPPTTAPASAPSGSGNGSFPCSATVNPNSASTVLNVVRQFPNRTSQATGSINRGESLTVIEASANNTFYSVQRSGQTLGWVAAEHLVLSSTCP